MYKFHDIRHVHLEISSLCNASCPWCPRTFWGYPYNNGYPETNLTLAQAKKIFVPSFLLQLENIEINGNFGDLVMNPYSVDIVEYFLDINSQIQIEISTNGGARDKNFWTRLAQTSSTVMFCLDGMENTHHLYRQNTVWSTVMRNAQTFIKAGGRAVWKMIRFDHNQHQIEQCRAISQDLGFVEFKLIDEGRDTAPVFDREGNLSHVLGHYDKETNFKTMFFKKQKDTILLEDIIQDRTPAKSVDCQVKKSCSVYIAANGDVSPCCWTGLYPLTYGHGQ
jgi:sulfatase maturation enzyme AslB (radical SAM superfamily)